MPINYEIHQIENAAGRGKDRKYVRLHYGHTMTAEEMERAIEASCSITRADVKAVMTELSHFALAELKAGNRFYLPELGWLSLSVGISNRYQTAETTGRDLYIRGIKFQPKAQLLENVRRGASFTKSAYSTLSSQLTRKETWSQIEQVLETSHFLTVGALCQATGLSKYKARKWLGLFEADGLLRKGGTKHQPLYFKT